MDYEHRFHALVGFISTTEGEDRGVMEAIADADRLGVYSDVCWAVDADYLIEWVLSQPENTRFKCVAGEPESMVVSIEVKDRGNEYA